MGDMSAYGDFGSLDVYSDPTFSPDTAPAGAGGDPYADAPPDASTPETFDTGWQPGGPDAQLTPFSPNLGFSFDDALRGTSAIAARVRPAFWMGGGTTRRGSFFGGGQGQFPVPQGGPGAAPNLGVDPGVLTSARQAGMVVRGIRDATGLRVSAHSLVNLIVRYGFQPVAAMTGATPADLLFLFMREKGVRHHHRGPGLYTIARTLRRADSLRARVGHILRGCVPGGRARRAPYHHMRRRRGRKR